MKYLEYSAVRYRHSNRWLPSFHLLPQNVVSIEKPPPNIKMYCDAVHLERQSAISVLDQTLKTMHFQVWEWTTDTYLKSEDSKDAPSFWNVKTEGAGYCLACISEVRRGDFSIPAFEFQF